MSPREKVNVLLVDDQPAKLLSLRTILEQLNENLLVAESADEALRHLLSSDVAVVLVDVCMPKMDGFELAELIRGHPRFGRTAIIFISAVHLTDADRLRGYDLGAVDYIPVPIIPEVLRAKVAVFAELHRKSKELERLNSDLELRVAERTQELLTAAVELRQSEAKFRTLSDAAPALIWFDDPDGHCRSVNKAYADFAGKPESDLLRDQWQLILHPDDGPAYLADFADAQRTRRPFQHRVRAQRSDGRWRWLESSALPLYSDSGQFIGHVGISPDVTERVESEERVRESERRYRQLVHGLAAAVYTCDAEGRITLYNQAAVELWGGEPRIGVDRWCGSHKFYRPDGSELPLDECPMAVTLRERRPVRGQEILIERPDGTRRAVMPNPEPIFDASGTLVGAVNLLADITDAKKAAQAQVLLAAVVSSSQDSIISKTLDGIITSWNAGAECMFGYTPGEIIGRSVLMLIPPELHAEEQQILTRLRAGEAIQSYETVRITKSGSPIDISLTISPVRDAEGRIIGASTVARDITIRKRAEAVLARDRETLERLVAERTAELERTNERLRHSDRMATIGTLSAGLGHDMGNLLFPVRMRLDSIERTELSDRAREDVAAIRKAADYLQRLAANLRLLALDPANDSTQDAATDLGAWWVEVEGMLRNGVSRPTAMGSEFEPALPAVRIGRASLTQVVFNLVQNAGDALKGRTDGRVTVSASHDAADSVVRLRVIDNGPGMSDEVRRRCIEPFFTTKTRGLSTGLGLALASSIVKNAGGSLQIQSRPQQGTTIELILPIAAARKTEPAVVPRRSRAVVTLSDRKLLAHVESALQSMAFDVHVNGTPDNADVWVLDAPDQSGLDAARRFTQTAPARRALVFGRATTGSDDGDDRVVVLEPQLKPSVLRSRICVALGTPAARREVLM